MSEERDLPPEPTGDAFGGDDPFLEHNTPEPRVTRPVTARGVALVGARTVAGLVCIGVAVVTIAAATVVPLPVVQASAPGRLVTPVPTAQQLVCPGPILRLADDSGQDATTASALGRPTVHSDSSTGSVDSTPVTSSDAQTGGTEQAPTIISTPPNAADPSARILLSGAQSQQLASGDIVGLAAAGCASPSGESWLVGGSTEVGRTTLLTLTNPTEVPATVDVQLFGESGLVSAPGTSGIIVPASGQRVLSLAGFQPGLVSPVVHVTSTGGQVVASLQQTVVRGLDPGGVDLVAASQAATSSSIIPGLLVTDVAAVQALRAGGPGFEDLATVLRLFSPADGAVSVTIGVVPEDPAQTGASFVYPLQGGRVADVPLGDLAAGSYTVTVESDAPLVAAARVTAASGPASDFAWFTPAPVLSGSAQLTAVSDGAAVLHLYNPGTSAASVTLSSGTETTVSVAPVSAVSVPLRPGQSYQLSEFDALAGAVSVSGAGLLAHYSVYPPGLGSTPVMVYPR